MSHDEILCRDFVELATAYLDGALPAAGLELVEEHLVVCSLCRTYLDQIATTASALGVTAGDEPPEETLRFIVGAFAARSGRST